MGARKACEALQRPVEGEGPCGGRISPAVLELLGGSLTLSLNLSPEWWMRKRCFFKDLEFKELWLGPTLEQTKTFRKHSNWEKCWVCVPAEGFRSELAVRCSSAGKFGLSCCAQCYLYWGFPTGRCRVGTFTGTVASKENLPWVGSSQFSGPGATSSRMIKEKFTLLSLSVDLPHPSPFSGQWCHLMGTDNNSQDI